MSKDNVIDFPARAAQSGAGDNEGEPFTLEGVLAARALCHKQDIDELVRVALVRSDNDLGTALILLSDAVLAVDGLALKAKADRILRPSGAPGPEAA